MESDVSVGALAVEMAHHQRTATALEAEKVLGLYQSTGSERVVVLARRQVIRSPFLCSQYSMCSGEEMVGSALDLRLSKELSTAAVAASEVGLGCAVMKVERAMET